MNALSSVAATQSSDGLSLWSAAKPVLIGTCGLAAIGLGTCTGMVPVVVAGKKLLEEAQKEADKVGGMGVIAKKVGSVAISYFNK